jgi:hypothetical protein
MTVSILPSSISLAHISHGDIQDDHIDIGSCLVTLRWRRDRSRRPSVHFHSYVQDAASLVSLTESCGSSTWRPLSVVVYRHTAHVKSRLPFACQLNRQPASQLWLLVAVVVPLKSLNSSCPHNASEMPRSDTCCVPETTHSSHIPT